MVVPFGIGRKVGPALFALALSGCSLPTGSPWGPEGMGCAEPGGGVAAYQMETIHGGRIGQAGQLDFGWPVRVAASGFRLVVADQQKRTLFSLEYPFGEMAVLGPLPLGTPGGMDLGADDLLWAAQPSRGRVVVLGPETGGLARTAVLGVAVAVGYGVFVARNYDVYRPDGPVAVEDAEAEP